MTKKFKMALAATALLLAANTSNIHAQGWQLNGNGNVTDTSKLGSKNYKPVRFFSNNVERMRLAANGYLGIGTNNPAVSFHLNASSTEAMRISGPTSMYASIFEDCLYRGYFGSYSGAASDVDFSTGGGNATGKLHLGIQGNPRLTVDASGNVGIGTQSPVAKTEIVYNSLVTSPTLQLTESGADYARLTFKNNINSSSWTIAGLNASTNSSERLNFYNSVSGNVMSLTGNGNVMIGASKPATAYKLSVGGKIMCEELKVLLRASWPDYVFNNDYKRMSIDELDRYIKTNKHLPGVAPAAELENNGVEVGEMQRILMEKVEELTLYIIELKKQNDELRNLITNQQQGQ